MSARNDREALVVGDAPAPTGPYSHVIRVGEFAITAGFGPHDAKTGAMPSGIAAQTHAAIDNLQAALKAVGMTLGDVVKTTVHLADLRDVAAYNEAYATRFAEPFPVRTTVQSGLMGFLIEIDAMALRQPQSSPDAPSSDRGIAPMPLRERSLTDE